MGKQLTVMLMTEIVRLGDVYEARRVLDRHLPKTPLIFSSTLSKKLDCNAYVKCENTLPTGAFKVRGGVNLISRLSDIERSTGVIVASTGNHAQSVAYAASIFGVKSVVGMPKGANPEKVKATRAYGARVAVHGKDYNEARLWVEREAKKKGYRYIHSANEPLLIAGVAKTLNPKVEVIGVQADNAQQSTSAGRTNDLLRRNLPTHLLKA